MQRNMLLKHVIKGKIQGRIELMERGWRRRKQLLDDLKEMRGYWKLKAEALDHTHILWRSQFWRDNGTVIRQTTEWMSEGMNEWTNSPFQDHQLTMVSSSFKFQCLFPPIIHVPLSPLSSLFSMNVKAADSSETLVQTNHCQISEYIILNLNKVLQQVYYMVTVWRIHFKIVTGDHISRAQTWNEFLAKVIKPLHRFLVPYWSVFLLLCYFIFLSWRPDCLRTDAVYVKFVRFNPISFTLSLCLLLLTYKQYFASV